MWLSMKKSDCNLPVMCLSFVLTLLCYLCVSTSSNSVITESPVETNSNQNYANQPVQEFLPDCDLFQKINQNRLIFVSTLDGMLTALDPSAGMLKWMIQTGPGHLLSSSIHKLELTNNGQWVRMIPSLSGGLYQFDGDSIEPIPITADNLLSSSFKFSDDLIMSGGKEIRSYSVSLTTGQLLYECSMHGCKNHTANQHNNAYIEDAILIRRQTQTVRAIEPRTGAERWNFSVGHNELELIRNEICHSTHILDQDVNFNIKIMVPEGIIYFVSKSHPQQILWQYKFEYPIVNAWTKNERNELMNIDIFTSSDDHWLQNLEDRTYQPINNMSPSIYIGMFQKQLYVQESEILKKIIHRNLLQGPNRNLKFPPIPWKPYPATSSSQLLIENDNPGPINLIETTLDTEVTPAVTALSVLYASEYVNGNGFFLYTSDDLNQSQNELCDKEAHDHDHNKGNFNEPFGDDIPVKYIVVSLWFWWKEILVIAISSTLLLNLFISRKISKRNEIFVVERHIEVQKIIEKEPDYAYLESICKPSIQQPFFQSRFITDFDLVRCLGKGGFGVVFEVKNKLDDCHYAIKRIVLPNKKESRDRVMREVKTLANCEHENIVRYFQAWVETPPNGWQANQDKLLFEADALQSTSIDIESTVTESKSRPLNIYKVPQFNNITNFSVEFTENSKRRFSDRGFDNSEDSSSFIVFRNEDASAIENSRMGCEDSCAIEFKEHSKDSTNFSDMVAMENKSDSAIEYDRKSKSKSYKQLAIVTTTGSSDMKSNSDNNPKKIYLYIQMQLCRKQSLREWLRSNGQKSREGQIINIFGQIVQAVEYVHLKGLIHRDLKPSNIFFSLDGQIKIGDFGLVTDMADLMNCGDNTGLPSCDKHTEQVGTYLYMSPEQLQGKPYNYKVDIYSLGLIFFELLVVFNTEMERMDTLKKLRNSNFPEDFYKKYNEEYKLLLLMLSPCPNERPTTFGIRANPPFNHNTDNTLHFHLDLSTLSRSRNNSVSIINGL